MTEKFCNPFHGGNVRKSVKNRILGDCVNECVLGIHWNMAADEFGFDISLPEKPMAPRGILSTYASLYDLLCFAAPAQSAARLLLQELCKRGLNWDQVIPEEDDRIWKTWLSKLPHF